MDLNKLSTADKVIGVSAIVFLIAFFLPWWGIDAFDFASAATRRGLLPDRHRPLILLMIVMVGADRAPKLDHAAARDRPAQWGQSTLIAGIAVGRPGGAAAAVPGRGWRSALPRTSIGCTACSSPPWPLRRRGRQLPEEP